ncbi:MAG TPA: elongation factor P maturation arginine rhamnosyltransferase EarP [Rhodoferax sp.]
MHPSPTHPTLRWDIFCRVIDNYGDIGVCWRLAVNLVQRGQTVRLWVDDASALAWMAPEGAPGVQVLAWTTPFDAHGQTPGDVLVEAFGCDIDPQFIADYASNIRARGQKKCLWLNLEYLSAESYVARCHTLPSPVMQGPGQGLTKHFFYPGFTPDTGGLPRDADLLQRQASFDRTAWLTEQGIDWQGQRLISLFCYEPAGLAALLQALAANETPTLLLVTAGRAATAVRKLIDHEIGLKPLYNKGMQLSISYLPMLSQADYDHLLWVCELNFVRGEDSLVRALWAGKPFVWQIYPQDDDAHHNKLNAFLDWLQAPASLRRAHRVWNGLPDAETDDATAPLVTAEGVQMWQDSCQSARHTLLQHNDLASQLLDFIAKTH